MTDFVKKAVAAQMAIKEHFIAQYLNATGALIQETALIEQYQENGTIAYWCEPLDHRNNIHKIRATLAERDAELAEWKAALVAACGDDLPVEPTPYMMEQTFAGRDAALADLHAEIAALKAEREQVRAAMQAMHPDHAGGMTDDEFAQLWNATLGLLDRETPTPAPEAT